MLTAKEYYDKYYNEDRRALQLTKYYLGDWGMIERNVSYLNEREKEVAFILFSALNKMTEAEREFLAAKYRVTIFNKPSKPDRELANEYDMKLSKYRELRKGIEYKFYYYLKPLILNNLKEQKVYTK